jgi:hypothetical protein
MKDIKDKIIVFLLIIISFIFGNSAVPFFKDLMVKTVYVVGDETKNIQLEKVSQEFAKIESKEDKLLIYKLFAGAGEYLEASKFTGSTAQFDPLLGKVQSSYGWNREKYPAFTTAVSDYLVSVKYDEPKNISGVEDRAIFAKIFKDLAGAVK